MDNILKQQLMGSTSEERQVIIDKHRTKLNGADLSKVDLSNLQLGGIGLMRTNLRYTNLSGANLRNAHIFEAGLQCANLRDANLDNARLDDANLENADLTGANIDYAVIGYPLQMTTYKGDLAFSIRNGVFILQAGCYRNNVLGFIKRTTTMGLATRQKAQIYARALSLALGMHDGEMLASADDVQALTDALNGAMDELRNEMNAQEGESDE